MSVFVLLALSLAAPPSLPHPPAPAPAHPPMAGVPRGGPPHAGARGGPDFLDRVHSSPSIARGIVRPAADLTVKDTVLPVHIEAWLKGTGPAEMHVDFGGLRPITIDGRNELFFLGPPVTDGGPEFRSLQDHNEQWDLPLAAAGKVDQAVRDAVAGAPDRHVLPPLLAVDGRLGQQAANRLGLLADADPLALAEVETALRDTSNPPKARAELMTFLPSKLSVESLVACYQPSEPPIVRYAALEALGRAAVSDPRKRPAVLPVLQAAAHDSDVRLQLAAGRSLAQMHNPEAIAPLNAVLTSTDPSLRDEAVLALGFLARAGDAQGQARLEALSTDSDPNIARRAQGQLASAHLPAEGGRTKVPLAALLAGILVVAAAVGAMVVARRRNRG